VTSDRKRLPCGRRTPARDRASREESASTADHTIEFYEDALGRSPVFRWITEELHPRARRAVTAALEAVLAKQGIRVCATEFGRNIGDGIFEFRLRHDESEIRRRVGLVTSPVQEEISGRILLRLFCHAHGDRRILLLAGYDKGANSHPRYQQTQIRLAKNRLSAWRGQQKRDSER
jgi:hypothetical protein